MVYGEMKCQIPEKCGTGEKPMNCAKCPFIADNKWKYCKLVKLGTKMYDAIDTLFKEHKITNVEYYKAMELLNKDDKKKGKKKGE